MQLLNWMKNLFDPEPQPRGEKELLIALRMSLENKIIEITETDYSSWLPEIDQLIIVARSDAPDAVVNKKLYDLVERIVATHNITFADIMSDFFWDLSYHNKEFVNTFYTEATTHIDEISNIIYVSLGSFINQRISTTTQTNKILDFTLNPNNIGEA